MSTFLMISPHSNKRRRIGYNDSTSCFTDDTVSTDSDICSSPLFSEQEDIYSTHSLEEEESANEDSDSENDEEEDKDELETKRLTLESYQSDLRLFLFGSTDATTNNTAPPPKLQRDNEVGVYLAISELIIEKVNDEDDEDDDDDEEEESINLAWYYLEEKVQIMFQMGVPALVLAAVQKWPANVDIQHDGMRLIDGMMSFCNCSDQKTKYAEAFLAMGWLDAIVNAMQNVSRSYQVVHEDAIKTLMNLIICIRTDVLYRPAQNAFFQKLIQVLVDSMQAFSDNLSMQEHCVAFLASLFIPWGSDGIFLRKQFARLAETILTLTEHAMDLERKLKVESETLCDGVLTLQERVKEWSGMDLTGKQRHVRCDLSLLLDVEADRSNNSNTYYISSTSRKQKDTVISPSSAAFLRRIFLKAKEQKSLREVMFQDAMQGSDAGAVEKAIETASELCKVDGAKAFQMGAHALVLAVMRRWPRNETVQKHGTACIGSIFRSRKPESEEFWLSMGVVVVETILKALQNHPKSEKLQLEGLNVLQRILIESSGRVLSSSSTTRYQPILQLCMVDPVLQAMRQFSDNAELQHVACKILMSVRRYCFDEHGFQKALLERDALPLIRNANKKSSHLVAQDAYGRYLNPMKGLEEFMLQSSSSLL